MAVLIPFPESGFKCDYFTWTKTLQLSANGTIPGVVLSAWLERDSHFVGGLKFSLLGFYGGLGPHPSKEFQYKLEEQISLPQPHFQNNTVIIETADATYTIKIKYLLEDGDPPSDEDHDARTSATASHLASSQAPDSQASNDNNNAVATSVLTPINEYLPGGDHHLEITARIPTSVPLYSINTSFNPEYLRMNNVIVSDGQVIYQFKWEKFPSEKGTNPQLLEVITQGFNGVMGPSARSFKLIQPYVVHGVLLEKS